jgi:hypothetical protein
MIKVKDSEKTNLKALCVDFDTEFLEDAYVWQFLTNDIAKSIRNTDFTLSEVVIAMIYDDIKLRIKDGRIKIV